MPEESFGQAKDRMRRELIALGHLSRGRLDSRAVRTEDFDLDRLRVTGEIADHILQYLRKFDRDAGHRLEDSRAD